jgi:predicted nucleic acid-binding protein
VKVALDTNVVLDLLLNRAPFADAATAIFHQIEAGEYPACVCATTITTLHYIAHKVVGDVAARQHIGQLLTLLELAPVDHTVIAHAIITRNGTDFRDGPLQVYSPQEWLNQPHH